MQENRSFDSYFGTYPGADGIPPHVCVPDPLRGGCDRPYHDHRNRNSGGPHDHIDALLDEAGGEMTGFVARAEAGRRLFCRRHIDSPQCSLTPKKPDVMGWHDWHEIPNYWAYARHFVLQDHMFQPDSSWSLPAHLFMLSGWSAKCAHRGDAKSCVAAVQSPGSPPGEPENATGAAPDYAWTDLTYLLHRSHVSWRYYVFKGAQPDCEDDAMLCKAVPQDAKTPGIWNPLPWFDTVQHDGQAKDVAPFDRFVRAARRGHLPAVSWVTPSQQVSEHPPGLVSRGQAWVTGVVNAIMSGPDWKSTAIFLTWDDWGGFYDHVAPTTAPDARPDCTLRGLFLACLVISPLARRGHVAHDTYDHTSVLKMIEWRWGLAPLSPRDAAARNLAEVLDFTLHDTSAPRYDVPPFVGTPCAAAGLADYEDWNALKKLALSQGWNLP